MYNTYPFQPFSRILSERSFYSKELNTMPTGRKMFVTVFHVRSCPFVIFHYYLDFEQSIISLLIFNCFNHNHISKIKWGTFCMIFQVSIWYNDLDNVRYVMISVRVEGLVKYRCNIVQKGFRKSLDVPHDITTHRDIRGHLNGHSGPLKCIKVHESIQHLK